MQLQKIQKSAKKNRKKCNLQGENFLRRLRGRLHPFFSRQKMARNVTDRSAKHVIIQLPELEGLVDEPHHPHATLGKRIRNK